MEESAKPVPRSRSRLKTVILTLASTAVITGIAAGALLYQPKFRQWAAKSLWEERNLIEGSEHSFRSDAIRERDDAIKQGELIRAADLNGRLSHEALRRALAVHRAWLKRADKKTSLYGEGRGNEVWNYRNTAADFFCFHLMGGMRLNPDGLDALRATLAAEEKLRTPGGLCQPVNAESLKPIDTDHLELIFASSEYVKDGLLSVFERYGSGEVQRVDVGQRMFKVVDAVIAQSKHQSKFGAVPSTDIEPNGNMLQICGRLSYATGKDDYAEFAARLADAIVGQALPRNNGLLPSDFDFEADKVLEGELKLKDHGNEAVLGLAEMYALAVARSSEPVWADRAKRWAEPVAKLFEIILEHGKLNDGTLGAIMQASPPKVTRDEPADNWGYILTGAMLYAEAAKRHGVIDGKRIDNVEQEITTISKAVFARPTTPWQGHMDSEADTVESAIYVAAYRPALRVEALQWADRQIQMMYVHQRGNGLATGGYLDGNFIRTSLLYADARSSGWRVEPYRVDVRVGYAEDAAGNAALTVSSESPYEGTLVHDGPRHQTIMKLPWDWPRLNSWPEWVLPSRLKVSSAEGAEVTAGGPLSSRVKVSVTSAKPVRLMLQKN